MRHPQKHTKNILVPALIICTLLLLVGCGGGSYTPPEKPYDIDEDIRQTEAEIQMHRSAITELEAKLKEKQSRLGGPSILELFPKSEAEKIEEIDSLKKRISRHKKDITRKRGHLDGLRKKKSGSDNDGGCS